MAGRRRDRGVVSSLVVVVGCQRRVALASRRGVASWRGVSVASAWRGVGVAWRGGVGASRRVAWRRVAGRVRSVGGVVALRRRCVVASWRRRVAAGGARSSSCVRRVGGACGVVVASRGVA
ncbi:hypothetical protein ACXZ9C_11850 [Streptococcus agalactiae]